MKHGLIGDSSSQVEQCKFSEKSVVTEEGNCSSLPLKSPSGISAPASLHYAQSGTSSYLQLSNALNNLASKVKGQVLTVLGGEEFELAASGVNCARIPTPTDLEVLPSTRPFSRPNFFNPSREVPIVFSSVRALGSSSSNGLDKSVMSPISQGEGDTSSTSNSFPSLHQMSHAHGIPVTTIPRTSMPLISPVHREGEFICGWGAAFINICVTFPINKAIFRQQLHGISGRRAIRQLRKDGLQYLYRGLLPPLLQKTMSLSVMFGMYFHCQDVLKEHFPKLGIVPNHAMAAMISGTLEASLMPFERIQTLMQNRKFHNRFTNTPDAFRHLWRYGLKEYYRGLSLIIWRNGPSNVVFFLGREYFQTVTPQPDSPSKKMLRDFVSGACLGAMISTAFFPLNVVKTRMQSKLGGPHESGWVTLKVLLSERKGRLRELFKGVHLNYTRSFISWGIINASFEVLMKLYNGESWSKAL